MPALPTPPLIVPECVIRARSPCVEIPAALSVTLSTPLLVTNASSPNTSIAAPERVDRAGIVDDGAIALHQDAVSVEAGGDGCTGEVADGVVVIDGNDGADRSGRVAGRDGAGVRHGAVARNEDSDAIVADGDDAGGGVVDRVVHAGEDAGGRLARR